MAIQTIPGSAITAGTITATQMSNTIQMGGPKISSIILTDSGYATITDTALGLSGGYIRILGTGFVTGCSVSINTVIATSVTFISSTEVRAQLPSMSAGTYIVYLSNADGGVAIRVNAITYSSTPSWNTTSPLTGGVVNTAISIQLGATSDSTISYTVQAGSTLPTGLTLSSGGLLSGTVTGLALETTYNFTIVATDLESQISPKAFSITIVVADQYFKSTVLLLNADVTPFTADASTNKFEISAVGTPSANTNNPLQPGYYSGYFNGSSYVSAPDNAAFIFGTGNFTIECWINTSSTTGTYGKRVVEHYTYGPVDYGWNLGVLRTAGNTISFEGYTNGTLGITLGTSNTLAANVWHHIAVVRSGSNASLYLDGTIVATQSGVTWNDTNTIPAGLEIGSQANLAGTIYDGYISNLRVVKGVAVYTGNFTPPTAPLAATQSSSGNIAAITGTATSLLTCQSNRFIDNSSTPQTITVSGTPIISVAQPFTLPSPYTGYGAGYFDGTNNNSLTVVNSASHAAFDMLSSNYTIEFWVYPTAAVSALQGLVTKYSTVQSFNIGFSTGSVWSVSVYYGGASDISIYAGSMPTLNTWHHAALVRNGANILFYVDGIQLATVGAQDMRTSGASICIGNFDARSFPLISSHVSNVRIVKGVAVYTGAFTPPSLAPLTSSGSTSAASYPSTTNVNITFASSATSLLTLQTNQAQTNSQFKDSGINNFAITRTGTVTQGTFTPFSQTGWSGYFNGTSALQTPASSITSIMGTNGLTTASVFTVECWMYSTARGSNNIVGDMIPTAGTSNWSFGPVSSGAIGLYWYNGAGYNATGSTITPLNTWIHIALVINGTNIKIYVNGTLETLSGQTTSNGAATTTGYIAMGEWNNGGATYGYSGYVNNLRIVKGVVVYTGNFTPPIGPLTATQSGSDNIAAITGTATSLLTLQDNRFKDNSTNAFSFTATGTPSVQAFSPFAPSTAYSTTLVGGSIYINGSSSTASNCLTLPGTNYVAYLGDGSFTVECWIYMVGTPPDSNGFQLLSSYGGTGSGWGLVLTQARLLLFNGSGDGADITGTTAVPINSWHHVALCSTAGTSFKIFLNGIQEGSTFTGGVSFNSGYPIRVGQFYWTGDYNFYAGFNGYISNLRIVKGTTVYTGAFTPPTAPLTATQSSGINISAINGGTVVLLSATNSGIFDATGKNDLITVGDARVSTSVTKYGTGAMYFDGTGDYILPAGSNITYAFGTGDFTVEFWLYMTAGAGVERDIIDSRPASTETTNYYSIIVTAANVIGFYVAGWRITGTTSMPINNWYHVALSRSSGSTKLFLNGAQEGSTYADTNNYLSSAQRPSIGSQGYTVGNLLLTGYLDDLRITKGIARYTTTFTPPTTAMLGQ